MASLMVMARVARRITTAALAFHLLIAVAVTLLSAPQVSSAPIPKINPGSDRSSPLTRRGGDALICGQNVRSHGTFTTNKAGAGLWLFKNDVLQQSGKGPVSGTTEFDHNVEIQEVVKFLQPHMDEFCKRPAFAKPETAPGRKTVQPKDRPTEWNDFFGALNAPENMFHVPIYVNKGKGSLIGGGTLSSDKFSKTVLLGIERYLQTGGGTVPSAITKIFDAIDAIAPGTYSKQELETLVTSDRASAQAKARQLANAMAPTSPSPAAKDSTSPSPGPSTTSTNPTNLKPPAPLVPDAPAPDAPPPGAPAPAAPKPGVEGPTKRPPPAPEPGVQRPIKRPKI
ncbi:hypothetical protein CBOM_05353 [Ceraceosorus bombacis]|uniref:Uncharacterized protein n=1 Tax=Ceraceosorus bombacis TaxID=401625 RepID=A0A0P1BRY9_9BASI|nr:hypothetical protein CBOM_05353 [Ceraceosorus bombacis]